MRVKNINLKPPGAGGVRLSGHHYPRGGRDFSVGLTRTGGAVRSGELDKESMLSVFPCAFCPSCSRVQVFSLVVCALAGLVVTLWFIGCQVPASGLLRPRWELWTRVTRDLIAPLSPALPSQLYVSITLITIWHTECFGYPSLPTHENVSTMKGFLLISL